ncbi:MAG: RnfH family protein [Methyloprofundus sp.]|nr:RnfH family protein [Methyloprofundus sp.]
MNIEVAYAKSDEQLILTIQAPDPCTVEQAIEQSGILKHYPDIDLTKNKVGIFSQICTLNKCLQENDRVEIYRSLAVNPMEARRQRAIQQQS